MSMSDHYSQAFLDKMSKEDIKASDMNPDLRKRLRVDRIKKKTMGTSTLDPKKKLQSTIEDPNQADW